MQSSKLSILIMCCLMSIIYDYETIISDSDKLFSTPNTPVTPIYYDNTGSHNSPGAQVVVKQKYTTDQPSKG